MEYMIVTAQGHHDLTVNVTLYLSRGWTPQGGIALDAGRLMQAMVKHAPEPLPRLKPAGI